MRTFAVTPRVEHLVASKAKEKVSIVGYKCGVSRAGFVLIVDYDNLDAGTSRRSAIGRDE